MRDGHRKKEKKTVECYFTMGFHMLVQTMAAMLFLVCFLYAGYALWDTVLVLKEPEKLKEQLAEYRPESEEKLEYSFSQLLDINPEVCAWLTMDNTHIDYPVVRGKDNFEYLDKNVMGEASMAGSIFLDCNNSPELTDAYSILMGHHMQGGEMFGDVELFTEEEFFRKNSTGTLSLPDRILELETVAILSADAYDPVLYHTQWEETEQTPAMEQTVAMEQLLEQITATALYTRGAPLTCEDQLIALSTCSAEYTDARYLLICRVTEERHGVKESEGS